GAIWEVLKPRPLAEYGRWRETSPRAERFARAVVVGELFKGAFRSPSAARHIRNIESRVLPAVTVLSYDVDVARVYGGRRARAGRGSCPCGTRTRRGRARLGVMTDRPGDAGDSAGTDGPWTQRDPRRGEPVSAF